MKSVRINAKDELLDSLIPSVFYKNYLKSINFEFTDLDIAALAWNKHWQPKQQIAEITKVLSVITDPTVKTQINERLEYHKKGFDLHCQVKLNPYFFDTSKTDKTNDKDGSQRINDFDPNRFENHFINFPNPFEFRDKVKMWNAKPGDQCGYVTISQKDWKDFLQRIENGLYVDFMDSSITVVWTDSQDNEEQFKNHDHIMPIYLEKVE